MPDKILVALDFSKLGQEVVSYACGLANQLQAEITFMHVIPEPESFFRNYAISIPATMKSHMTGLKKTTLKKLQIYVEDNCQSERKSAHKTYVDVGDPAPCIVEYAKKQGFDMILLGFRGHNTFDELLIGSTAQKVLRYAPCSVLVYRPDKAHA